MSALGWQIVALCAIGVLWRFLESYLRGLRSERQVLAKSNDELRADLGRQSARIVVLELDATKTEVRVEELRVGLNNLAARTAPVRSVERAAW